MDILRITFVGSVNILIVIFLLLKTAYAIEWTCQQNATAEAVDLEKMAGVWYEVARFPPSEVPACLKVTAPTEVDQGNYTLHLDYMNNLNTKWAHVEENISFPWDEAKQGNFSMTFSGGSIKVNVDFKYMGTFENYALVCGYSGIASDISILRLLSRNATVDESIISDVIQVLNVTNIPVNSSDITWVEQGAKCSGSEISSSMFMILLVSLFKLYN